MSLKQTESIGLRFNKPQDALDYANHLVEDAGRWLISSDVNIANRYEKGDLEIAMEFGVAPRQFHLIFRAIPLNGMDRGNAIHGDGNYRSERGNAKSEDGLMFVGVTQFVNTPEKIIPSSVWFARDHHVEDFFGDVLGTSICSTLHLGEIKSEGELCILSSLNPGGSIDGLVRSAPQITNNIEGATREDVRHILDEFDLVNWLSCIRIFLNDISAKVLLTESVHFPFKLNKASLGMAKTIF